MLLRNAVASALVIAAAAAAAAVLHGLELGSHTAPPLAAGRSAGAGQGAVQLREIQGLLLRRLDPASGALHWQLQGEGARPLGEGQRDWQVHGPQLVIFLDGPQAAPWIASAHQASVFHFPGRKDLVRLEGEVHLEHQALSGRTSDLLLEFPAERAREPWRGVRASTEQQVVLELVSATAQAAPARLLAAGLVAEASERRLRLLPPVRAELPGWLLATAGHGGALGRPVAIPGRGERALAPEDRLLLETAEPVWIEQPAPGHAEVRCEGPLDWQLVFAGGAPALAGGTAAHSRLLLGWHGEPPAAPAAPRWVLEGLAASGLRWREQPGAAEPAGGRLSALALGPEGTVWLGAAAAHAAGGDACTLAAPAGLELVLGASRLQARAGRYEPAQRRLVLEQQVRGTLGPELAEPLLEGAPALPPELQLPWELEGERLELEFDAAGSARRLVLAGEGRQALLRAGPAARGEKSSAGGGQPGLRAWGDRIEVRRADPPPPAPPVVGPPASGGTPPPKGGRGRVQLAALVLELAAHPGSRALQRLELGGDRLEAERIGFEGASLRARASGRVHAVRTAPEGAIAFEARGEQAVVELGWCEGAEPRLLPRSVALAGPDGIQLRLVPELLLPQRGQPARAAAPPPLELRAAALALRIVPAREARGRLRARLLELELGGQAERGVRLDNPARVPLAARLGLVRSGAPGTGPLALGDEPEWLETARARLDRAAGRAELTGGVRGRLGLVLPQALREPVADPQEPAAGESAAAGGAWAPYEVEGEQLELDFVEAEGAGRRPVLQALVASGRPLRVRGQREGLQAARLQYQERTRTLELCGPPLEVFGAGGRRRYQPAAAVRVVLPPPGDE